ncbi:hypothetical protein [Rathayibacter soli]|nr:hypothetical protein [Glaciibacter superstes]
MNVVLINPRDVFVEGIRLHEFAAGSRARLRVGLQRLGATIH